MQLPEGHRREPATDAELVEATEALEQALPAFLQSLYAETNGFSTDAGLLLYSTDTLAERNQMMEVGTFAPGHVAIGDDSGAALLVAADGSACWVDMASMDPELGEPLGCSLADWVAAGLPLREHSEGVTAMVDIYLVKMPSEGMRTMSYVNKHLGLELKTSQLEIIQHQTPVRLLKLVPYPIAIRLCREVNKVDPCVGVQIPRTTR